MDHLEPGASFGPYAVEGLIAAGGMGQVYAARHDVYGSVCALKILHEKLHEDEDWRARFNEEGLVGTQLKHPHVLSARELVEHDGRIAIVMDLVKGGQTLEKVVSREFPKGLPLTRALQVFLEIAQGIDYLHGKGIVHGDLKPENVMIEGEYRRPETWTSKLTDFGTVGLVAHPVIIDGRTAVVATPRYASPEHLRGTDNLEVRSDVYCLGLILHYLLSGQHCSDSRTVREAAVFVMGETPVVHLVDQPEPVIEVFRKCTKVSPALRFKDCRELALAIRAALDGLGVTLDLEDVQADLATEVDEERAEAQRENLNRASQPPAKVSDTELPTEIDDEEPRELTSDEPGPPAQFEPGSRSEVTLEPDFPSDDDGDSVVPERPPSGETTMARPAPSDVATSAPEPQPVEALERPAPISSGAAAGAAVMLPVLAGGAIVIVVGIVVAVLFIL